MAQSMTDYGKLFADDFDDMRTLLVWAPEHGYTEDNGKLDLTRNRIATDGFRAFLTEFPDVVKHIQEGGQEKKTSATPKKNVKEQSQSSAASEGPRMGNSMSSSAVSSVSNQRSEASSMKQTTSVSSQSSSSHDDEVDPALADLPIENPGVTQTVGDSQSTREPGDDGKSDDRADIMSFLDAQIARENETPAPVERREPNDKAGRLITYKGSLHGYVKEVLQGRGSLNVNLGNYDVPYQFGQGMHASKTMPVNTSMVKMCEKYWLDKWPSEIKSSDMSWMDNVGRQVMVESMLVKDFCVSKDDWVNYWLSRIETENTVPKRQKQFRRINFNPVDYILRCSNNSAEAKFRFMWGMVLINFDELVGRVGQIHAETDQGKKETGASNNAVMNQLLINQRLLSATLAALTAKKLDEGQLDRVATKDHQKLLEELLCGQTTRGYDAAVGKYAAQILKTAKTRLRTRHNHR